MHIVNETTNISCQIFRKNRKDALLLFHIFIFSYLGVDAPLDGHYNTSVINVYTTF